MADDLRSYFPDPQTLLSLHPEELAGVLLEMVPDVRQAQHFHVGSFVSDFLFYPHDPRSWPHEVRSDVENAVFESLSWLTTQGLVLRETEVWHRLTRRGRDVKSPVDLEAFRRGKILPVELLPDRLAAKVQHLFLRGDHDIAVFQAFKEVEITVRNAANARGANFPDNEVGVTLMQKAFHPENGVLRDKSLVFAERQAEAHLFAGAIGHAKNPTGHREVNLSPHEAVRLIVFASHLLQLLSEREAA